MIFRIKLHWWSSLIAAGLMLAVAWRLGGTDHLQGRFDSIEAALATGVAGGVACGTLNLLLHLSLRASWGQRYSSLFRKHALDVVGGMRPVEAVAGGLMAALGEEPFFRGVLLARFTSPVLGVVITAVLFGLAHYLRREFFGFFIWAIGEGLAFGILFMLTGSILVPAVAHGTFDTVGFLYFQHLRRLPTSEGTVS